MSSKSKPTGTRHPGTTPGRPRDSGSRQQNRHDQQTQTGSPPLDDASRRTTGSSPAEKPASAK